MKAISIELPDEIVDLFDQNELEASLRKWAVLELVRAGKLSSGKAAEVLVMTRWEFMSDYDVPVPMADFPEEELEKQLAEKASGQEA